VLEAARRYVEVAAREGAAENYGDSRRAPHCRRRWFGACRFLPAGIGETSALPLLSRNLEKTLRRALMQANARYHEYATLKHLLLALLDDEDAAAILGAVEVSRLRAHLNYILDRDPTSLVVAGVVDAKPTAGFQRVIQHAAISVQNSGRGDVTGADVLDAVYLIGKDDSKVWEEDPHPALGLDLSYRKRWRDTLVLWTLMIGLAIALWAMYRLAVCRTLGRVSATIVP
jgi:hypothetical protein